MSLTFLKTLLVTGCLFVSVAHSQPGWKTFNHKNGFTIQLPSSFSTGVLVAGGTLQWYNNAFNSKIELTIESAGTGEAGKLKKEFEREQATFSVVSYKVLKPAWYVVSGSDEQGICYLKTILKNGILFTFRLSYPASQKATVDAWIPKIAASFR